ncbi:MAG: hypothetical protein ACK56I_07010 [bacterium]
MITASLLFILLVFIFLIRDHLTSNDDFVELGHFYRAGQHLKVPACLVHLHHKDTPSVGERRYLS